MVKNDVILTIVIQIYFTILRVGNTLVIIIYVLRIYLNTRENK